MKINTLDRKNMIMILLISLLLIIYYRSCNDIAFIEYISLKFFNNQVPSETYFMVQIVNETSQNRFCYFTVTDRYFDMYESRYLFYTYFPRHDRTIIQQIFIAFLVYSLIKSKKEYFEFRNINFGKFFLVFLFGISSSYLLINNTTNYFSEQFMTNVFIIFSLIKCNIAYFASKSKNNSLLILILMCYPFTSTGLGIPWFYDFIIYYSLFLLIENGNFYLNNKKFLLLFLTLSLSLIHSFVYSPSLEQLIIDKKIIIDEENKDKLLISELTFLEMNDLESIIETQNQLSDEEFEIEVKDLSRNIKDVTYPHRWKYMVSILPDTRFHTPSLIWYLGLLILFFNIIKNLKTFTYSELKLLIQKGTNILIFYQLFSLFFGFNQFFNSFSNLFFLNRNAELITLGEIQTWRGVADHYEVFSNFQVFCFCFFIINYYMNKNLRNFLYILFPITTAVLSQSRWSVLVVFLFLFLLLIMNYKKYFLQLSCLIIFAFLLLQYTPVFERTDPFFDTNRSSEYRQNVIQENNELIGFEFISGPLNRTLPWTMFYTGYKPDAVSLIFGNGPGAYLNLVKNTSSDVTSGPHSSVLQILNKFGLINLIIFSIFLIMYILKITKNIWSLKSFAFIFSVGLLISFEIKTDSLMIMDGVYIFGFNLVLISLIGKLYEERV